MRVFSSKDFWVGAVLAVLAMYLYQNHLKGMGSGGK